MLFVNKTNYWLQQNQDNHKAKKQSTTTLTYVYYLQWKHILGDRIGSWSHRITPQKKIHHVYLSILSYIKLHHTKINHP